MTKLEQTLRQYLKRKGHVNYGRLYNYFEKNQKSGRRKKSRRWFKRAFAISMLDLFENNEIVFLCEHEYHNLLACWSCEVYYLEKNDSEETDLNLLSPIKQL